MRNCGQLLYAETMSNPLMTVLDLEQFGQLGSDREGAQHERLTIVDATFSSPQLVKPIKHGIDIVIHSAYVYLLLLLLLLLMMMMVLASRTSQSTPCQCDRFARKRRESCQWKLLSVNCYSFSASTLLLRLYDFFYAPPWVGALSDDARLTSV